MPRYTEEARRMIRTMNEPIVYRWFGPAPPPGRYKTKILLHVHHVNDGNRISTFYITEHKEAA